MQGRLKRKAGIRRKITLIICIVAGIPIVIGISSGYFIGHRILNDVFAKYHLDPAEILAALDRLIFYLAALSVFLIVTMVPVGFIFGGVFVRPILKLHNAIMEVSRGNLDYKLEETGTNDEIEECADSFRDMVSNIKARQEEILKQHTYTEAVISSLIDTLIVVDSEGILKTVNRATLDLLGYEEKELVGQSVEKIFAFC